MRACGSGAAAAWWLAGAMVVTGACEGGAPDRARPPVVVGALELVADGSLVDDGSTQPLRRSELATWSGGGRSAEITYVDLGLAFDGLATTEADVWLGRPDGLVRVRGDGVRATTVRLPVSGWASAFVRADDGTLWFALSGAEAWAARLDPSTGHVDVFRAPAPVRRPTAMAIERRSDGERLWLGSGDAPAVATVEARDGERAVSVVASEPSAEVPLSLTSLAVGAAGDVWVGDFGGKRIGRVAGGEFRWLDLAPGVAPGALAIAGDGRPWFAVVGAPTRLGRVRDGAIDSFVVPAALQSLSERAIGGLAVAPDGALLFSLPERDVLGRLDREGSFSFLRLSADAEPRAMAFDARGVLWVATSMGVARVQPL